MTDEAVTVNRQAVAALCLAHGVAKLSLFGSVLRSDFNPIQSDVDVLVEFAPGVHRGLFKLLAMQRELEVLFGRKVDLTTPGSLSKYFREDVLATARVLYDAA